MNPESRKPLWLLPNLLSLDAPLVAVAWLYIFAKTWRVNYHPWEAYLALGLVVWAIYAGDRMLDHSMKAGTDLPLEERHKFHARYRLWFGAGAVAAVILAVVLVISYMPVTIFNYLFIGGALVVGFFALSLSTADSEAEIPYLKNIVAGLAFAFGTSMLAHVYLPGIGVGELLASRQFLCFAVLCILNISAIDLWQHASRSSDVEVKATDELALTLPLTVLAGAALFFALMDQQQATRPFFYAILTGAALLQVLNRTRNRYSMGALRVLADVALLAPLLVFLAFPAE